MAEVLRRFTEAIVENDGVRYRAQACAAPMADGLWQGWIEFIPIDGGTPIRTPRETTQPNRAAAIYWATGLTAVYLEGALDRALNPLVLRHREQAYPVFDAPAPDFVRQPPPKEPPRGRDAIGVNVARRVLSRGRHRNAEAAAAANDAAHRRSRRRRSG